MCSTVHIVRTAVEYKHVWVTYMLYTVYRQEHLSHMSFWDSWAFSFPHHPSCSEGQFSGVTVFHLWPGPGANCHQNYSTQAQDGTVITYLAIM